MSQGATCTVSAEPQKARFVGTRVHGAGPPACPLRPLPAAPPRSPHLWLFAQALHAPHVVPGDDTQTEVFCRCPSGVRHCIGPCAVAEDVCRPWSANQYSCEHQCSS